MSTQSHIVLMRRDDRIKLTDEDNVELRDTAYRHLKEAESKRQTIRESSSSNSFKGLCAKTQNEADVEVSERRFHYLDEFHYVDRTDNSVWVVIDDQWFSSSFSSFIEEFKVTYDGEKSQYFISAAEARDIKNACEYILNGNYDSKFEELIGEHWIHVLENVLPSYGGRFRKKREKDGLCLFVEKSDGEGWKITDSIYEWSDGDSDESETEGRCILESLSSIMSSFIRHLSNSIDWKGEQKTDVKLMFYIS